MKFRRRGMAAILAALSFTFAHRANAADAGPQLQLENSDHISLIGNTLADRMQHDGWLETLIQSRFSSPELVFRDLGFAGDEVNLKLRLRSKNFGTPDEWLTRAKTDVVFAFFGYNEAYAGPAGIKKFKDELDAFVKDTLNKKYNGKSAPKLVLFSPVAHEDLHSPNLPNGEANNKDLKTYTDAMGEVAKSNKIIFVDLFTPSQELYAKAAQPLTVDGIHMTAEGDHQLAIVIDKALFGDMPGVVHDAAALEKVRQAVVDKNFYWFNRYRTLDGYNVYGDRADVAYAKGLTNRAVMDREMEALEVMASNRDKRVWAAVKGVDMKVVDNNLPQFVPVESNRTAVPSVNPFIAPNPDGTYKFLGGEEAIGKMTVADGMKVNLFASEEQFPELEKPVQMSFDNKGRLWVAVWPSYPHWKPTEEMNDKLLVFEDTKGTGKADKVTVFADHLHCPTGFAFYNGGVILAQAPGLLFLKDTKGTGHADYRERLLDGLDSADSHHTANSFVFDPGGSLYFQEGTFLQTQVETPWGAPERSSNAAVYRFEPKSFKFEAYAPYAFANPHGHVFDRWGIDIITDGTSAVPYYGPSFTGKAYYPDKRSKNPPVIYKQRTRPCAGTEILSSKQFPDDMQGNLLVCNDIGFRGILNYKLNEKGAGIEGIESKPIISSSDFNFHPSAIEIGPEGSIYFLDWQNPLIGHLQHHLRDPNRDHTHGRIYRITYTARPQDEPAKIAGEPVDKLLGLLKSTENRVRYRARTELGTHDAKEVTAAVDKWLAGLDKNDKEYSHDLTEALWAYQWQNVVNEALLKQVLTSPDYHARAAGARVLCYWRDRVAKPLDLFRTLAKDDSPRVRLEAVRACSFFTTPEAADVALESLNKEQDSFLKYTMDETMKTLDRFTRGR